MIVMRTLRSDSTVKREAGAGGSAGAAEQSNLDANTEVMSSVLQMLSKMDTRLQRIEAGQAQARERIGRVEQKLDLAEAQPATSTAPEVLQGTIEL